MRDTRPWTALEALKKGHRNSPLFEQLAEQCCEDHSCSYWLIYYFRDLPESIQRKAALKCCEHPYWASCLRRNVSELPEEIKRLAEDRCCEEPMVAADLRMATDVDLPEETKRKLELAACRSPAAAFKLRVNQPPIDAPAEIKKRLELKICEHEWLTKRLASYDLRDLCPEVAAILSLVRLGMDVASAREIAAAASFDE